MMARFYYVHVNTYQRFSLIINNEGIWSRLVNNNNIYDLAHIPILCLYRFCYVAQPMASD